LPVSIKAWRVRANTSALMLLKASDKPMETLVAVPPDSEADREAAPAIASMLAWLRARMLTPWALMRVGEASVPMARVSTLE
jgi:hypothetical protein